MVKLIARVIAGTVTVAIVGLMSVVPCMAAEKTTTPPAKKSLARITPAGMQVLMKNEAPVRRQDASAPGSFLRSRKGVLAVVLVAVTTGFTLWSVSHDRKPVKSPVR